MNRRKFLNRALLTTAGLAASNFGFAKSGQSGNEENAIANHKISLSQWTYHHYIYGDSRNDYGAFIKALHRQPDSVLQGSMDPRDIVIRAREFGLDYVDLVNILWFGKAKNAKWLAKFNQLAKNEGVGFICLMCDELGQIGSSDKQQRAISIDKHRTWMETAAILGCSQFRVNAYGDGSYLEQLNQNAESLYLLAESAQEFGLTLLVENHGHPSSNAAWLAMLMEQTAHKNLGVLLDLDNFFMGGWNHNPQRRYDRRQGVIDLAPFTKGVSAKTFDFDADGNETKIDYEECFKLLYEAGFNGPVCAEYEGEKWSAKEGSEKTISLIRKTIKEFSA